MAQSHVLPIFRGMTLPVTGVLNLTNRQKIMESKAIELSKPPPTTTTLDRNTPSPTPLQHMSSFIIAATGGGRFSSQGANSPHGGGRGFSQGGIGSNS